MNWIPTCWSCHALSVTPSNRFYATRYATRHKRDNPAHRVVVRHLAPSLGSERPKLLEEVEIHRPVVTVTGRGMEIPAMSYGDGRTVISVGHVRPRDFLADAQSVFTTVGIDCDGDLHEADVEQRWALVHHRRHGHVTVLWRELASDRLVDEHTADAVPVTLVQI